MADTTMRPAPRSTRFRPMRFGLMRFGPVRFRPVRFRTATRVAGALWLVVALPGEPSAQTVLGSDDDRVLRPQRGITAGNGDSGPLQRRDRPVAGQSDPGDLQRVDSVEAGPAGGETLGVVTGIEGLTIADFGAIDSDDAGEITAAVVPPYRKPECPAGRLLVSVDGVKDPEGGEILRRDLDDLSRALPKAAFSGYVQNAQIDGRTVVGRRIRSNDQEIAALPNGDVLYMRMGQSRVPPPGARPNWFDHAYKITDAAPWGPGARSELFIFRSTDCGENFALVSRIDTAEVLNGVAGLAAWAGGLPQHCDDCPVELANGRRAYQMAGSDGPTLRTDRDSGHAFISIGIYGYHPLFNAGNQDFALSDVPVNRTVVMRSIDGGTSWQRVAVLNYRAWRLEITPFGPDFLLFAEGNFVQRHSIPPLTPATSGDLTAAVDQSFAVPGKANYWAGDVPEGPVQSLRTRSIGARLPDPGTQLLVMADTENRSANGRKGWRAFAYDWNDPGGVFTEFQPAIMPQTDGPLDYVFNPVVVDPGAGPTFAYWYDVRFGGGGQAAAIRGRLFLGKDRQTADFTIRAPFTVTTERFFGHYQSAGGYYRVEPSGLRRSVFYPVWIEPPGRIRFARVEYREQGARPIEAGTVRPGVLVTRQVRGIRAVPADPASLSQDWHDEHEEEETRLESGTFGLEREERIRAQ